MPCNDVKDSKACIHDDGIDTEYSRIAMKIESNSPPSLCKRHQRMKKDNKKIEKTGDIA